MNGKDDKIIKIDKVVFNVEDFIKAVEESKKGDIIFFNEFSIIDQENIRKRNWYIKVNKDIVDTLEAMRKSQKAIILYGIRDVRE